ncbi:hypothetical protein ABW21_db0202013 [Orbilia brochopaga]|nr:hypothetical protein ABW21_db0202013 [Drechslerella brochopaga]
MASPSATGPAHSPPKIANPHPPHLKLATNIPMVTANNGSSGTPASRPSAESATQPSNASPASAGMAPPRSSRPTNGGKRPNMRQLAHDQLTMNNEQREQKLKDIINEQFGLEILIKHRELQDIDAELGKAEACLEQIRRCAIHEAMEKDGRFDDPVTANFTYTPSANLLQGPYSEWLMEERDTRNLYHDVLAPDLSRNFSIGRRATAGQDAPAPPMASQRPQREAAAAAALLQKRPSICLHRQHDGTIVKLTCIDCKRSQFGSMQGFINHCRLAHQRDFQTHDHAAAACGTPFDTTGYDGQLPPARSSRAASNLQTGPPTPPFNPEDFHIPKTIQTSHLKEWLSKKRMEVENIDTMVEEAVNRVGIVDESDGDEEEGEGEVSNDAGISEKPADATPAPAPAAAPPQDSRPQANDVKMMDAPIEKTIEVKGDRIISVTTKPLTIDTAVVGPAHEAQEAIVEVSEISESTRTIAPQNKEADKEASPRPSSRRSNAAARQSPRTPVGPAPPRMGTRAHPSPDAEASVTRHSARLADFGKRT